ncbi:SMI1/KNR4 family protein [Ktedonobacter sp. SOSP1-85]|uniref:SMI1/KNR4 family protein n=1 Tax=Ktedonobacter sp. SOSP1-85 TaxID=2778367 RepID=UPI001915359A|nr:SMI1/KNR4 family protein [Ktedonobacter sp. SOSP1-85]
MRWYIPQRKTCLVLKPEDGEQEPIFAFLPATEQQVRETEQQLGFPLPPLLRLLYTQIANGGFGPGFGIIGGKDGYPGVDHVPGNIARRYQWEIDFADALRQWDKGGWASLTPEGRQVLWEDGIGSQELWESGQLTDDEPEGEEIHLAEEDLTPPWPKHLLPLCEHGCNITTYLFADTEQVVQGMHNPYLVVAASLEEWLERWLAGETLQLM